MSLEEQMRLLGRRIAQLEAEQQTLSPIVFREKVALMVKHELQQQQLSKNPPAPANPWPGTWLWPAVQAIGTFLACVGDELCRNPRIFDGCCRLMFMTITACFCCVVPCGCWKILLEIWRTY